MTGVFVPVIPRNLRLEVTERVEASGRVREPIDEAEVRAAVTRLARSRLRSAGHPLPACLCQPGA